MPSVSILIPAFRPQYLDLAIASALAQSYTDFELLISDDSGEEFVASVVSKWDDPRIRFYRNPDRQAPGANRDFLLGLARGRYIKFLFDDDFLLPQSVAALVRAADDTQSQMVFHGRYFVDSRGCVLPSPLAIPLGQRGTLERRTLFEDAIGSIDNFIGEPSSILFETEAFRALDRPFAVAGFPMRFLTDMALFINFLIHGYKITGIGFMGSAFRQHDQQSSNAAFVGYSAGLFEWELLLRWAVDRGELDIAHYEAAMVNVHTMYERHIQDFPELQPLLDLGGRRGPTGYWSDEFVELVALAYMSIDLRRAARLSGSNQVSSAETCS